MGKIDRVTDIEGGQDLEKRNTLKEKMNYHQINAENINRGL